MSQARAQTVISCIANATIAAHVIVKMDTANNTVALHDTNASLIFGVTTQASEGTGTAIPVCIAGCCKVRGASSITVGALIAAQTATGLAVPCGTFVTATAYLATQRVLGIAMESCDSNATFEVFLQQNSSQRYA